MPDPPVVCPRDHVLHRKVVAACRWEPVEWVAGVVHGWSPCRDEGCSVCEPYCGCRDCREFEDLKT